MKITLFLCTGNYYRSRFAEALFNFEVEKRGIGRTARSAGLAREESAGQGPISPWTEKVLNAMGIPLSFTGPEPRAVTREDFWQAERVIAMDRVEHYPLIEAEFGDFKDTVEYWEIGDLEVMDPVVALPEIARQVDLLLMR